MAPPLKKPAQPVLWAEVGRMGPVPLRSGGSGGADQAHLLAEVERHMHPHVLYSRPLPTQVILAEQVAAQDSGVGIATRRQVHNTYTLYASGDGLRSVRKIQGTNPPNGVDTDAGRQLRLHHGAPGAASRCEVQHVEEGEEVGVAT